MQAEAREPSYAACCVLQVWLARNESDACLTSQCRECFVPLVTFRFRRALEPHINVKPDGPRRTALRPAGNLLIAFSGGLGSTVLLDLVNRCYANPDDALLATGGGDGGRDHPRHERVWQKVTVCYVEICDAIPGVITHLSLSVYSQ